MLKKLSIKEYNKIVSDGVSNLDQKELNRLAIILKNSIKKKKYIFICGNGGSAAIANHFLADYNKILKNKFKKKFFPKFISLNNSNEMMTAISNDISYKKVFTNQLENFARKNDVLIVISCSGKSPNIIDVANYAKNKELTLISFTGFSNYLLKNKSEVNLHVGINDYGVCEDVFHIIMHYSIHNIINK